MQTSAHRSIRLIIMAFLADESCHRSSLGRGASGRPRVRIGRRPLPTIVRRDAEESST